MILQKIDSRKVKNGFDRYVGHKLDGTRITIDSIFEKGGTNKHKRYLCRCDCGNTFVTPAYPINEGRTKSCGCFKNDLASVRTITRNLTYKGSNHPRWKPEISREKRLKNRHVSDSLQKAWRHKVFERDGYLCVICKNGQGNLRAHHLDNWAKHPDRRWDIDNGITLCRSHHIDLHNTFGYTTTKEQYWTFSRALLEVIS
jgi:5-methylcytosine-specific restriction endonuclease McrA